MIHRKPASYIPFAFAASLLSVGWHLLDPGRSLFAATIFSLLGILLTGLATIYYLSAGEIAALLEQRGAIGSPIYRLWLPPHFFCARTYFWMLRVTAVLMVVIGIEFVAVGARFLIRYG